MKKAISALKDLIISWEITYMQKITIQSEEWYDMIEQVCDAIKAYRIGTLPN